MITDIGKNLIGKYLVGQSTQYASHIALGCGVEPITLTTAYGNYATTTELDFEMTRVPIISRSYISDRTLASITNIQVFNGIPDAITFTVSSLTSGIFVQNQTITVSGVSVSVGGLSTGTLNTSYKVTSVIGYTIGAEPLGWGASAPTSNASVATTGTIDGYVNKISFVAELPTDNRYEITELGLWSDLSNPLPSGIDNKNIFNFGRNKESWKYTSGSTNITSDISYTETALDNGNLLNNFDTPATFSTSPKAFLTNSDNAFFNSTLGATRVQRWERPRFLDDALMVGGDLSKFEVTGGTTILNTLDTTVSNNYLTISGINLGDLDINQTTDELVLAYSLISKLASATTITGVESVNIMFEFLTDIDNVTAKYHFRHRASDLVDANRYQTINVPLSGTGTTPKSASFLWKNVVAANIYASIQDSSGNQVTTYFLALDGLNLINKNNVNSSNYGLVSYVPVKNSSGVSIVKEPNTSSLIEFRLVLGTVGV